jgi:hypothetical protein
MQQPPQHQLPCCRHCQAAMPLASMTAANNNMMTMMITTTTTTTQQQQQ